jgi:hypothetical protein
MIAKEISSYSGPWVDAEPVANPTTQQSAASANRHAEDSAQMTRTASRIMVKFTATVTTPPIAVEVDDSTSVWGEGMSFEPVIAKTGVGVYTITYATEYADALVGTTGNEAVAETEQVSFRFGWGSVEGSLCGHVQLEFVNNVITVYVFNAAGSSSDLGGTTVVSVFAR